MIIGEITTSGEDWDRRWYGMAEHAASFSKDPKRKVGGLLVSADQRQLSIGYNGFPRGTPDIKAQLMDEKCRQMLMVHGEINAVNNAPFDVAGSTLYATKFPCHVCAGVIANARIARIVTPRADLGHVKWGESYKVAMEILTNAGIEITAIAGVVTQAGASGE
jgi:dCMP deaminase